MYSWTSEGANKWPHNEARRNASKNAENGFKEFGENIDNPSANGPLNFSKIKFLKGSPGKIPLAETLFLEALELVNPKSGYVAICVYGQVRGDDGCEGKGRRNMKKVEIDGIHIPTSQIQSDLRSKVRKSNYS